ARFGSWAIPGYTRSNANAPEAPGTGDPETRQSPDGRRGPEAGDRRALPLRLADALHVRRDPRDSGDGRRPPQRLRRVPAPLRRALLRGHEQRPEGRVAALPDGRQAVGRDQPDRRRDDVVRVAVAGRRSAGGVARGRAAAGARAARRGALPLPLHAAAGDPEGAVRAALEVSRLRRADADPPALGRRQE